MVWSIGWADEPAGKSGQSKHDTVVSLETEDAPLGDVLRLLSRQTGVNIVFDENAVKGKVAAKFKDKPLSLVLKYLCEGVDLQCRLADDVYIIEPKSKKPTAKSSEPASADAMRKRITELELKLDAPKGKYADSRSRVTKQQTELEVLYELAQAQALEVEALPDVTAALADLAKAEEALNVAEVEMQRHEASLTAAEAELKAAEENLRELQEKYKAGTVPQAEVRQAETAIAKLRANRDKIKIALTLARTRMNQQRAANQKHLDLVKSFANRSHLPGVGIVSEAQLLVPAEPLRKMVSLSEKNAKLEDILRKLSQQAGIPITIHESVSRDIQVTNATLYGVTLADALHLLLQQAGLRAVPSEDRKGIVIVPPNRIEVKGSTAPSNLSTIYLGATSVTNPLSDLVAPTRQYGRSQSVPYLSDLPLIGQMFKSYSPSAICAKCKTPLQPDWLFCPKCGAKNERTTDKDWKFCPTCGRAVSTTGSASGVTTTGKKK